jgi:hypothetical protein
MAGTDKGFRYADGVCTSSVLAQLLDAAVGGTTEFVSVKCSKERILRIESSWVEMVGDAR